MRAQSTGNLRKDPPPPDPNDPTIAIRVNMTSQGYTLGLQNQAVDIPKVNGTYDTNTLLEKLKFVKQKIPQQTAVTVAPDDNITYEEIMGTMDQIVTVPMPDIVVMPAVNT